MKFCSLAFYQDKWNTSNFNVGVTEAVTSQEQNVNLNTKTGSQISGGKNRKWQRHSPGSKLTNRECFLLDGTGSYTRISGVLSYPCQKSVLHSNYVTLLVSFVSCPLGSLATSAEFPLNLAHFDRNIFYLKDSGFSSMGGSPGELSQEFVM